MATKEYQMQLKKHWIDNIYMKINLDFQWPQEPVDLKPTFVRNVIKQSDNSAVVVIDFNIKEDISSPFALHLSIGGLFELNDWEKTVEGKLLMSDNASAILFPFLRQAISEITTMSGLPPYVLPITNVAALFKEQR